MAVGTILGAVGGIVGGVLGLSGASKQAKAAEQATAAAIAEQRRQFDLSMKTLQPWFQAGGQAVQRLAFLLGLGSPNQPGAGGGSTQPGGFGRPGLGVNIEALRNQPLDGDGSFGPRPPFGGEGFPGPLGPGGVPGPGQPGTSGAGQPPDSDFGSLMRDFSMADFEADPGYAFRLSEGMKALERSASARGGLFSGGTLRGLTRYGQDVASNEYLNAYNRFQTNRNTRYNFLAGLAGLGQQSASQLVNAGMNSATNIGNWMIGGATSAAAARASGYGALGGALANAPLNYFLLSQLGQGQPGGCWVFTAIYGKGALRTRLLWSWLTSPNGWAATSPIGKLVEEIYFAIGEQVAGLIRALNLKAILRPVFNHILRTQAIPWARGAMGV